jgi:hypothetical protein
MAAGSRPTQYIIQPQCQQGELTLTQSSTCCAPTCQRCWCLRCCLHIHPGGCHVHHPCAVGGDTECSCGQLCSCQGHIACAATKTYCMCSSQRLTSILASKCCHCTTGQLVLPYIMACWCELLEAWKRQRCQPACTKVRLQWTWTVSQARQLCTSNLRNNDLCLLLVQINCNLLVLLVLLVA